MVAVCHSVCGQSVSGIQYITVHTYRMVQHDIPRYVCKVSESACFL